MFRDTLTQSINYSPANLIDMVEKKADEKGEGEEKPKN
jgi:hypothetical protein